MTEDECKEWFQLKAENENLRSQLEAEKKRAKRCAEISMDSEHTLAELGLLEYVHGQEESPARYAAHLAAKLEAEQKLTAEWKEEAEDRIEEGRIWHREKREAEVELVATRALCAEAAKMLRLTLQPPAWTWPDGSRKKYDDLIERLEKASHGT